MATGSRRLTAALLAVFTSALLLACAPSPAATPSPTDFASEEEAFAAAEETYRDYIDASNARRLDPDSVPDPTDFLTGSAYNDDSATQAILDQRGLHLVGVGAVASIEALSVTQAFIRVVVCLDATNVQVIDSSGADVTPEDRIDILAVDVTLIPVGTRLVITESTVSEETC